MPTVPTGIKQGVGTSPWGVWKMPARAWVRGQVAKQVKEESDKRVESAVEPFLWWQIQSLSPWLFGAVIGAGDPT
ncbi:MAG: hypothetical protein OHK0012_01440 [Synechococcales cyanobacterium]